MPDQPLRRAYLDRLTASMSLPDAERLAAAEEIAAHVDEAMADMQDRGLPAHVAEQRALERLGAPERLASDLTAARRHGGHALAAVGTALRVSVVTGVQYLLFAWAAIMVVAIAVSIAVAGVHLILGAEILQADWTPLTASLFPAIAACAVAYGVGRTILPPVAVAARRSSAQVRVPLAVAGACVSAWFSLAVVEAPYHVAGALLMATTPAWFLGGLLRRRSRPAPILSSRILVFTLTIFVVGGIGLVLAAGGTSSAVSFESEAWDPNVEYAQVGPIAGVDHPPLEFAESEGPVLGPGPGPVRLERSWTAPGGFLEAWSDLRLEVWAGPSGMPSGPGLDPAATEPLATAPIAFDGRRLTGTLEFVPRPDREFYYVATTGIGPDGIRMQLTWPDLESWRWEGTVVDFVRASLAR